MYNFLIYNSC